jgi:hypothetical protein
MGKLKIYFTPQKPNHFSFIWTLGAIAIVDELRIEFLFQIKKNCLKENVFHAKKERKRVDDDDDAMLSNSAINEVTHIMYFLQFFFFGEKNFLLQFIRDFKMWEECGFCEREKGVLQFELLWRNQM